MNDVIKQLRPRGPQLTPEQSSAMLAAVVSERRPQMRHRRLYMIAAASLVAIVGTTIAVGQPFLAGSRQDQGESQSAAAGRCVPLLRVDGVVYQAWGYVDEVPAARIGNGDLSVCDDNGENPSGPSFPGASPNVQIWSLGHEDPDVVVGVRRPDGFAVYMAAGVEPSTGEEIFRRFETKSENGAR